MSNRSSNRKALLILLVLFVIAVGIGVIRHNITSTKFNTTNVNGAIAGNLYNNGLFCENNGQIYYSNPSDNFRLYVMNADGSNSKKLSDDTVSYINVDEHYVYYVRNNTSNDSAFSFLNWNNNSLCRINKNGGNEVILENDPSLYASLVGNKIYYMHYTKSEGSTLYEVSIDGSDTKQVKNEPVLPGSSNGYYLYYAGEAKDHSIYRMDTRTNVAVSVYDGICYYPVYTNDGIYFLDAENDYHLCLFDPATGDVQTLIQERIDCYNILGSYIYFQKNSASNPALCRYNKTNGEIEELIAGTYHNINVTSSHVYFYDANGSSVCYTLPVNRGTTVEIFK